MTTFAQVSLLGLAQSAGDPPSSWAIESFVQGEAGAVGRVVWLTLWRAVPIGIGLRLVGQRNTVKSAAAASSAVTTETASAASRCWC